MGTGIVFVVLVAIWAAYFMQYWSRRREHLATARSVEAFSESMRVLERRPPVSSPAASRSSLSQGLARARTMYAESTARPQVMAKPRVSAQGAAPAVRRRPARPTTPAQKGSTMHPSRKVRGLTLLASLATLTITLGLAAFSVVTWWIPLAALVAVLGSFSWLRAGVQAQIKARRASRQKVRRSRPVKSARVAHNPVADQHLIDTVAGDEAELLETSEVTAAASSSQAQQPGWQPVPVPPPTYTLKAKAERATPAAPEQPGQAISAEAPDDDAAVHAVHAADADAHRADEPQQTRAAYGT